MSFTWYDIIKAIEEDDAETLEQVFEVLDMEDTDTDVLDMFDEEDNHWLIRGK